MATLKDIKARINTTANIKKITKAMQLVAAAKLTKAQERAQTVRPYTDELDGILGALAAAAGSDDSGESPIELSFVEGEASIKTTREVLFTQSEVRRPGIVLFTSDRGLCGAFNTNLIKRAQATMDEHADKDCKLITIGRKGNTHFKRCGADIIFAQEDIKDSLDIDQIKELTGNLVNLFVSGEVDALYLVFAKSQGASFTLTTQQFLSIPTVEADEDAGDENYIFEPEREQLYATLIPLYATTTIFSALADTFASEYAAKMAAMQQATKNADEKLGDLVILRNRMRQATITKELAEIVGGAEALNN